MPQHSEILHQKIANALQNDISSPRTDGLTRNVADVYAVRCRPTVSDA